MRVFIILFTLLFLVFFLKPSKLRKFFLVYGLIIGAIGLLVYEGNNYVDSRTTSMIVPSQIDLENFRMDTTLQLFLKGRVTNNAPGNTIKEIKLLLTVYADNDPANGTKEELFGTQEFILVTRIGPGEHKDIIQKVSIPGFDPEKHPLWDLKVVSVKSFLWD